MGMSHYNNAYGGCFTGDTKVLSVSTTHANGSESELRRVDSLKKGDWLISGRTQRPVQVACVVKTVASKPGLLKVIRDTENNYGITPWHPIISKSTGKWVFPAELAVNEQKQK